MNLEKYLNLLAIILGFVGTIFILKGVLRMTPEIIGEIGQTKWGYNLIALENISIQKADTITGFALIVLAFVIQIINEFGNFNKIIMPTSRLVQLGTLIFACFALCGLFILINKGLCNSYKLEAGRSVTKSYLMKNILRADNQINWRDVPHIEGYASTLLRFDRNQGEADKDYLFRLSKELDVDLEGRITNSDNGGQ